MAWVIDGAGDHEGWVAKVLDDGRVAGATTGGGVIVHDLTAEDIAAGYQVRRYPGSDHVDVVVPWERVATWRGMCECGWTGPERPAVTEPEYDTRDCPEDVDDKVFFPAWRVHVGPIVALNELADLAEQLRDLECRVDQQVQHARAAGASWSEIGRELRLSKQGAQQRWGAQEQAAGALTPRRGTAGV